MYSETSNQAKTSVDLHILTNVSKIKEKLKKMLKIVLNFKILFFVAHFSNFRPKTLLNQQKIKILKMA